MTREEIAAAARDLLDDRDVAFAAAGDATEIGTVLARRIRLCALITLEAMEAMSHGQVCSKHSSLCLTEAEPGRELVDLIRRPTGEGKS